jgi:hypothetical protein
MNNTPTSLYNALLALPYATGGHKDDDALVTDTAFQTLHDFLGEDYSVATAIDYIDALIIDRQYSLARNITTATSINFTDQMQRIIRSTETFQNTGSKKHQDTLTSHWQDYATICLYNIENASQLIEDITNNISVFSRLGALINHLPLHDIDASEHVARLTDANIRISTAISQQYRNLTMFQDAEESCIKNLEQCKQIMAPYLARPK